MELTQGKVVYLSSISPVMTDQDFNRLLIGKSENTTKPEMRNAESLIVRGLLTFGKDRKLINEHSQIIGGTYHTENGQVLGRIFLLEKEDKAKLLWQGPSKEFRPNYMRIRDELAGPVPYSLRGRAANK